MKQTCMKQTAAMLTAFLVLAATTGCSRGGSSGGNGSGGLQKGKGSTLQVSFEHSYSSERLDIGDYDYVGNPYVLGDNLLISVMKDSEESMILYSPADGSTKTIESNFKKNLDENASTWLQAAFATADDKFCMLYGGYMFTTNEDGEDEYQNLGSQMEIYDMDMNLLETKDMSKIFTEDVNLDSIYPGADGGYYISAWDNNTGSQSIGIYDKDFRKTGEVKGDIGYLRGVYTMPDGSSYMAYEGGENWSEQIAAIDPQTGTLTPMEIEGIPTWYNSCFAGTDGNYDLYVCDSTAAYGIRFADKTCEEVINWVNSDFMGNYVSSVTQLKDGRFLVNHSDIDYTANNLWLLSPRDPAELENVKVLSLASLGLSDQIGLAVNQFNRSNSEYRIVVKDYYKYSTEDDWQAGLNMFKNDMTSGIVADLICVDGLPYESLAAKGIFADLTEKVNALDENQYFTNAFRALSYGDKLYRMGFSFSVQTLEGKTELVGNAGKTVPEFVQMMQNLPDGMDVFYDMTKNSALYMMVYSNLNAFIDVQNSQCHFDMPEFVQILELCNTYPDNEEQEKRMEQFSESDWADYSVEQSYQFINDKVLLRQVYLSDLRDTYRDRYTYMGDADVSYVGFPTADGSGNGGVFSFNGTLAISSSTAYPDVCWQFFESMLTEEAQENLQWALPVSRAAFDKKAEESKKPETYTDENGQEIPYNNTIWRGEEEIELPAMPQSFADEVKSYIENVTVCNYYDEQIYNIITEEAEKFFAGDQSAQQAADMIQSRASLYLSEQS